MHYADERVSVRRLDTPKEMIKNKANRTHTHKHTPNTRPRTMKIGKVQFERGMEDGRLGRRQQAASSAIFVYDAFEIDE